MCTLLGVWGLAIVLRCNVKPTIGFYQLRFLASEWVLTTSVFSFAVIVYDFNGQGIKGV